jgi:hypothetical protein
MRTIGAEQDPAGAFVQLPGQLPAGAPASSAGSILLIPWNGAKTDLTTYMKNVDQHPSQYPDPEPKWRELTGNINGYGAVSIISYTLGLVGLVGFGISFAF